MLSKMNFSCARQCKSSLSEIKFMTMYAPLRPTHEKNQSYHGHHNFVLVLNSRAPVIFFKNNPFLSLAMSLL